MSRFYRYLGVLEVISLFINTCSIQAVPAEQVAPNNVTYEIVLGKSLSDKDVAGFIVSNNCSSAMPYILCKEVGMALLIDTNQIVEGVIC